MRIKKLIIKINNYIKYIDINKTIVYNFKVKGNKFGKISLSDNYLRYTELIDNHFEDLYIDKIESDLFDISNSFNNESKNEYKSNELIQKKFNGIEINYLIVKERLKFQRLNIRRIFINYIVTKNLLIENNSIDLLQIIDIDCKENKLKKIEKDIYVKMNEIKSMMITLMYPNVNNLILEHNIIINYLSLIGSVNISNLIITLLAESKGKFHIMNSDNIIEKIKLTGKNNSDLKLHRFSFEKFVISSFENNGKFSITNLNNYNEYKENEFVLINSSFEETEITGSNFRNTELKFMNIKIKYVEFLNVNYFKKYTVIDNPSLKISEREKKTNLLDLFKQLKISMIRQGNKVNELYFQAYEFNTYYDLIKSDKSVPWQEKLVLWISKHTNFFGINWWKPIIQYVIIIFYLYLLLGLSFNNNIYHIKFIGFYYDWEMFFQMLNPTHSYNLVQNKNFINLAIDFLSRLVSSFYIFQIIYAFRKYFR